MGIFIINNISSYVTVYFYLYQYLKYFIWGDGGWPLSQENLRTSGLLASFIFKDHMK